MSVKSAIRETGQTSSAAVAEGHMLQYGKEVTRMAQTALDSVIEQVDVLSVDEQLRLIAHLAERVRTHTPATRLPSRLGTTETLPDHVAGEDDEKLTITERLARANYKGGALFKTAEEVDAYIRAERDSWER